MKKPAGVPSGPGVERDEWDLVDGLPNAGAVEAYQTILSFAS
jgi:hypothetical protein